jgi:multidrug transporter EmrE-like cation transporter
MTLPATQEPEQEVRVPLCRFNLAGGSGLVYAQAAGIDPAIWEAAFGQTRKDYEYYRLLEDTMADGFVYRFLLLLDKKDNPVALQPLILVDQDLTASIESTFSRVVAFLRKFWDRFFRARMLMAGCLVGDSSLGLIAPARPEETSALLAEALLAYAREEKISLIAIKDFPAALRREIAPLHEAGYARLPSFPPLVLDLNFASFEDYMEKRLSRATRKGLRRKLRKADGASPAITMEVLTDCSSVIDEIYPLYLEVVRRSEVEFEVFSREYFLEAGKRMPERHRFFIWRRADRVVAFSFCTLWDDCLYDNDIGLDYAVAHDLHLYYMTFRDVIVWALRNGCKKYYSGPFNYDPKLHLRLQPIDVDLYVRHTSGKVNFILKRVAPSFAPAKSDPALRAYSEGAALSLSQRLLKAFGNPWLQLALNGLIVTASELFLKLGARATAHLAQTWNWTGVTGLASAWTWAGIVCIIFSLIGWLYILRHVPLSIAFPLSNTPHILVPLTSSIFLGEMISGRRWCGIVLVLIGLVLVAKPIARIEEKL